MWMIVATRQRDPERSRERILAAALEEFSARGFAGARVGAIARRAGLNKQLISHHFGGKRALYAAAMSARRTAAGGEMAATPPPLPRALRGFFDRALDDPSWLRVLLWETLDDPQQDVPGADEIEQRRRRYADRVEWVRGEQQAGRLPAALDPELLLLSLFGAALYPVLLPHVAELVTGEQVTSARFGRRYRRHLEQLATALAP